MAYMLICNPTFFTSIMDNNVHAKNSSTRVLINNTNTVECTSLALLVQSLEISSSR